MWGKNKQNVDAPSKVVVVSDESFVEQVLDAGTPVLVDFWATWCGPCKFMAPVFAELSNEYEGKVKFAKLDVDENPGVSSALGIQSIPTFALFDGHKVVDAGVGAMPIQHLRDWLETALSSREGESQSDSSVA